jgi:hypothetical protein
LLSVIADLAKGEFCVYFQGYQPWDAPRVIRVTKEREIAQEIEVGFDPGRIYEPDGREVRQ